MLTDNSSTIKRRTLERINDFYAKKYHKKAPLEECKPSIERQRILSELAPSRGLLLDVGCWDCSFSQHLKGIEYIGIDINRRALEKARSKKIDVVLASCDLLPFRSEVFDACSMIEVIEHLYFPSKAIKEAHRILKPDGKLILATPNFVNFIDRISVLVGKHEISGTEHQHIRFFTWQTLNNFLEKHGFELEKRKTWFLPFPTRRIVRKNRLWRKLMGYTVRLFPNLDEGLLGGWRKVSKS